MRFALISKWNYLEGSKDKMKDKIYIIGLEPYLNLVNPKGDLLMLDSPD